MREPITAQFLGNITSLETTRLNQLLTHYWLNLAFLPSCTWRELDKNRVKASTFSQSGLGFRPICLSYKFRSLYFSTGLHTSLVSLCVSSLKITSNQISSLSISKSLTFQYAFTAWKTYLHNLEYYYFDQSPQIESLLKNWLNFLVNIFRVSYLLYNSVKYWRWSLWYLDRNYYLNGSILIIIWEKNHLPTRLFSHIFPVFSGLCR